MLVCVWVLAFKGLGGRLPGCVVAQILCVVSAWIGIATYFVKLILFYAGGTGRSTVHNVIAFWRSSPTQGLASIILGPVALLYCSLTIYLVLITVAGVSSVRGLYRAYASRESGYPG